MFEQSEMETEFTDVDQVVVRQQKKSNYQSTSNGSLKAATEASPNGSSRASSKEASKGPAVKEKSEFTPRAVTAVIILNFINLLNYVDRGTVPGVLTELQTYFQADNQDAAYFQFVFIVAYMLLAPLFGYLADRYNRKILMIIGIALWSLATLGGSFSYSYGIFLFWRGAVGIGEASYSTIAPAIIADLFTGKRRSYMLTVFYIAIPVGGGLGYGVASVAMAVFGDWRWAFRLTPVGGLASCLLLFFLLKEPKRGEAEGPAGESKSNGYAEEMRDLARNRTYVLATFGFTGVTFAVGALMYWTPACLEYAMWMNGDRPSNITFYFGIFVMVGGLGGTSIGSFWATKWKLTNPSADALVCAIGSLAAGPLIFLAMLALDGAILAFWLVLPVILILLCLNWAVVVDITTYVVPSHSRSTAIAFQTLMSHLLGDAFSPLIVGALSDEFTPDTATFVGMFIGLREALYVTCFISVLGGLAFFQASHYLPEDKKNVEMRGKLNEVVRDIVEDHEEGKKREQEEEAQRQSQLYQQKTEAKRKAKEEAAAAAAVQAAAGSYNEAVLMRYMRRSSHPDGHVNLGYRVDVEEEGAGGQKAMKNRKMRPISEV